MSISEEVVTVGSEPMGEARSTAGRLLLVNANVNRGRSRTNKLSDELVNILNKDGGYEVDELILEDEHIPPLTSETLARRTSLAEMGRFGDEAFGYARSFVKADIIVISAPYWDMSFPAMLKCYLEAICVPGLLYRYTDDGKAIGLCKAERLYYMTTCGGLIGDRNYGFENIRSLATLFGIRYVRCISAEGLDIVTNDAEAIMAEALSRLPESI